MMRVVRLPANRSGMSLRAQNARAAGFDAHAAKQVEVAEIISLLSGR